MAKYKPQLSHCDGRILSCALDVLGFVRLDFLIIIYSYSRFAPFA